MRDVTPKNGELLGGLGGRTEKAELVEPENEYPLRGDNEEGQLERRAIHRKWPEIDEPIKKLIVNRQSYLAASKDVDPETNVKAFRALDSALDETVKANNTAVQVNVDARSEESRAIDRKRLAEAELAELRLAEQRGKLVDIEDVRRCFGAIGTHLKSKIDTIGRVSIECKALVLEAIELADQEVRSIFAKSDDT
jgi:hypothetical protein